MSTQAQVKANQKNALKSTGPKSNNGKQIVSRNALRHSLLAKHSLMNGENEDEFRELSDLFFNEFAPEGITEEYLVETMVSAVWRLRRIMRIESGIFEWVEFSKQMDIIRGLMSNYEKTVVCDMDFDMRKTVATNPYPPILRFRIRQFNSPVPKARPPTSNAILR